MILYGILAVVIFFVVKYYIKYRDISKLRFMNVKFDFKLENALSSLASLTVPARISIDIHNMSGSTYELNNAYLNIFDKEGVLVATPTSIMKKAVVIPAGGTATVSLDYELQANGIARLCKNLNIKGGAAAVLRKYLTDGQLGVKLLISGYVNAEGFTKIDIPVNTEITV
ncbi:MAG: hypothetical protein IKR41_11675 [Bacteroidales bacterium]|nr:hypothetical protein [Bacteroidales bacterium]